MNLDNIMGRILLSLLVSGVLTLFVGGIIWYIWG